MEESKASLLKKILINRGPEIILSFGAAGALLLSFASETEANKTEFIYDSVASALAVALFVFCLITVIFHGGKEIRGSLSKGPLTDEKPATASWKGFLGTDPGQNLKKPGKKRILSDILIIVGGCVVFTVVTLVATYWLRRLMGHEGSFWGLVRSRFESLDSQHYLYIAEHGYTPANSGGEYGRVVEIVFFPGYPLLTGLLGLLIKDYFVAGMIVSIVSFTAAAVLLYLLMLQDYERKDALFAVAILFLMPGAFFLVTPMSESLFLALTLGTILLIRKKLWLPAGICGMFCAFTRSAGVFVALIFVFELFKAFLSDLSAIKNQDIPGPRSGIVKTVGKYILRFLPVILIGGGLIGYLIINYVLNGDPFSFVYYERVQWSQSLGWFFETAAYSARNIYLYLAGLRGSNTFVGLTVFAMNLLAMYGILGTIAVKSRKLKASYVAYALIYFAVSFGVTWLLSGIRYTLGLFIMPMALAAGRGKYFSLPKNLPDKSRLGRISPVLNLLLVFVIAVVSTAYMAMFCAYLQIW